MSGACGRMGQAVLKAVQEADGLQLVGAVDVRGGADTGTLVGFPATGYMRGDGSRGGSRAPEAGCHD